MVSFCINFNLHITNYNTFHLIYFQSDIFLLLLHNKLQERRKKKNDMAQMHLTPLSKLVDDVWGEKGTEERDAMEKQLKEEVNAYYLGEAIRKARQAQKLTQEELGERIGVQRAQISRLEKGHTIMTLPTLSRVFRALGIASATLDLGAAGKVALW